MLGALIYITLRSETLVMFSWAQHLGVDELISSLRTRASGLRPVPGWIRYSLPDAAWAYSFAAALRLAWLSAPCRTAAFFWTALGPMLAIVAELGQAIGVVPGTFDSCDLTLCALTLPLAILLLPALSSKETGTC